MALDINDRTVFWGAVSSNYFWGKRSGMIYTDWQGKTNAFKIKKWANGRSGSGQLGNKNRMWRKVYNKNWK